TCSLPPQPPNESDSGQCPYWPTRHSYFPGTVEENSRHLPERNQAAVLTRIMDCPEPEFVEHADPPEKKASNSQGKNYANTKNQDSQENPFRSESAMKTIRSKINCSKHSEEKRRLLH